MRLSIVSSMYCSAPHLREFHARVVAAAEALTDEFEIVLVNDGSPDESLQIALGLHRSDPRVRVIDLSRNFGHHPAMLEGLRHAKGDRVLLIDCDLEEPPELLAEMTARLDEPGIDVAYGVQDVRRGRMIDRWSGRLFYKMFNALSSDKMPENLLTVRLMSRRYLDALLSHTEVEVMLGGLFARTGFRQVAVPVRRQPKGSSTYTLAKRVALMVNAVTSFSNKPLVYVSYLGAAMLGLFGLAAAYLVLSQLIWGEALAGWTSLIVSVWLVGGLIIFCQGVLGIYLAKMFAEVKRRPQAIVREIHESPLRSDDRRAA